MKSRGFLIAIFLLVVLALWFLLSSKTAPPRQNSNPTESSPAISSTNAGVNSSAAISSSTPAPPTNLASRAAEVVSESSPATNLPPKIVLQNVRRVVRQYGEMFGGDPVGTNPEITRQLSGENPKHINFIDPQAGLHTDKNGNLTDPWNTPYFFHQISGAEMEIHSAGPDKIMWTADDLVVK